MTIDDWRARYDQLNAETDRLRAEAERLRRDVDRFWGLQERAQYRLAEFESELYAAREDAARARWCEDRDADVVVYGGNNYDRMWTVVWIDGDGNARMCQDSDRNAAIDAARGTK